MADGTFNPTQHLRRVNGNQYLEVKWRLVWLRSEHPDAVIETYLVQLKDHGAIFKATVTLPSGGVATGYGSETAGDFGDYIEKAETKAIGRALLALGYGHPEPDEPHATTPPQRNRAALDRAAADLQARQERGAAPAPGTPNPAPDNLITLRQLGYLKAVAREAGVDPDAEAQRDYGVVAAALSRRDASALIQRIQDAGVAGDPYP